MARKDSIAKLIRETAKAILEEGNSEMKHSLLALAIQGKLKRRLRSDHVLSSLAIKNGGFEIHEGKDAIVVALKGKFAEGAEKKEIKVKTVKLTVMEFIGRAIERLGKDGKLHTVCSGFNAAFKEYFGKDPVEEVKRLVKEGKIYSRPAKKGAVISLHTLSVGQKALEKMGLL